jgi:DNA-binding FadR family transcriptional regulator
MRLFKDQPIPPLVEMDRMLELRQVLEETAAGLEAVRASQEDLDSMTSALQAMQREGPRRRLSVPICAFTAP